MRLWPLWLYGGCIVLLTALFLLGPTTLQLLFRLILGD